MAQPEFCYDYPRPAVSADCVVIDPAVNEILLIQRKNQPFRDMWAFPGGFLEENERIESAASRELLEETGLKNISLKLIGAYSEPGRDPRTRVITLAYLAVVEKDSLAPVAGDDAKGVQWFPLKNLPPLAFDHERILEDALHLLRELNLSR